MSAAERYAEAVRTGDRAGIEAAWAPNGTPRILGLPPFDGPAQLAGFHAEVRRAFPDITLTVTGIHADGDTTVVTWEASGTHSGEPIGSLVPSGRRLELELADILRIRDGLIDRGNLVFDCSLLAAQLDAWPHLIAEPEPEPVAGGVWVLRGGYPMRSMNVYLIEDGDGVTVFDAGIRAMAGPLKAACDARGGARRVVLGHGHSDHRACAVALGVPVYCHRDERDDAKGDGGLSYMDMGKLAPPARHVMGALIRAYDGPAPRISGTLAAGDEVAGFTVVELPGHAPGQIGLWRERDRIALVSDTFYLTDMDALGKPSGPRIPHPATTLDPVQAADSIRRLAALEPAAAWPGHLGPLTGDVRAQLERVSLA
jgi:glyoxylase-like metal-dependent hydrolase (beta-lactamase superfamily II)/predicted ester cyclase